MLTLILLVVLGGGAGLLAVSLSDHPAPWTARRERRGPSSLRPYPAQDTSPIGSAVPGGADAGEPWGDPFDVVGTANSGPTHPDQSGTVDPPQPTIRRYRRPVSAPAARTAIEGPYGEVATAAWWQRSVSLVLIVAIVGLVGVGVAAVLGATIAAVAELVDGAIG